MPDKTTIGISDLLRKYIKVLAETIVFKGEPFDEQKKKDLQLYSQDEGVDYATLEKNLLLLFEIADELKTLESKTVEALLAITARECYLSDKEIEGLIKSLKEQRATTQGSTGSGEATTYEEAKNWLIETCLEKEKATTQAEAVRKDRLEAENQLNTDRESLEKTLLTADSDAAVRMENKLNDLQMRTVASNQHESTLKNELEKATKQMEEAQRIFEHICGQNLEDKERKKTKIAIVITSIVIVALYVALFLIL